MTQFGPYAACGMILTSELDLPELLPAPAGSVARVRIVLGPCEPLGEHLHFRADANGSARVQLPGELRMHVSPNADEVRLDVDPRADPLLVRAVLYGTGFALLLFRMGLVPLHGSCLRIGSAAVVLSGDSGAGKSTLATALMRRGHTLVSDDLCAIELKSETPVIYPAFPRVKLLHDTIAHFNLGTPDDHAPAAAGMKGHFRFTDALTYSTEPLPLQVVVALSAESADELTARRLGGMAALGFLRGQVHRAFMGSALGYDATIFRDTCNLADRVPVFALDRPRDLSRLQESAEAVERLAESLQRA